MDHTTKAPDLVPNELEMIINSDELEKFKRTGESEAFFQEPNGSFSMSFDRIEIDESNFMQSEVTLFKNGTAMFAFIVPNGLIGKKLSLTLIEGTLKEMNLPIVSEHTFTDINE